MSNCERKRIIKNHRQNYINDFIQPALKTQKLETKQIKYKTMAQEKKQKILQNRKRKYEKLDKSKKEELLTKNINYKETMSKEQKRKTLENKRAKYEAMDQSKKEELLIKNMNYKETMSKEVKEQKQKILENERDKYEAMDQSKKKQLLTKNMNYKETMSKEQKRKTLEDKRAKYEAMDQLKKKQLLTKNMNYKKTMGEEQKQKLLENTRAKYQAIDISKKKDLSATSSSKIMSNRISLDPKQKNNLLDREKEKRMEKKSLTHDIDMYIEKFKKQIKSGPFYICCVCNRTLYKKSVVILQKNKYSRQDCFMLQRSFDGKNYICRTCHAKLLKDQQPCQAVVNNLFVDETPTELAALEKLEQILVAQRIVFEKIVIMPKGQQRKIKGAICNVPVECSQTCNVLPRPPDRSGIILLKLKRKLQFRGHVYFQAVRPQFVISALNWLVANNPLYRNIEIHCDNISSDLTNLNCPDTDQENIDEPLQLQSNVNRELCNEDVEEQDDPLNEHRSAASETCLQSVLPNYPVNLDNTNCNTTGREVFNIAPGEGKHPVSLMTDKLCEELSFPVLFPKGRFGYLI